MRGDQLKTVSFRWEDVVLENHKKLILTLKCKYSKTEWNTRGRCNERGATLHQRLWGGNTKCLKCSTMKMSRRSSASYSRGVCIWHKYTHITHSYTHNIHKPENKQAILFSYYLGWWIWCILIQNRNSGTGSVLKIKSKLASSQEQNAKAWKQASHSALSDWRSAFGLIACVNIFAQPAF